MFTIPSQWFMAVRLSHIATTIAGDRSSRWGNVLEIESILAAEPRASRVSRVHSSHHPVQFALFESNLLVPSVLLRTSYIITMGASITHGLLGDLTFCVGGCCPISLPLLCSAEWCFYYSLGYPNQVVAFDNNPLQIYVYKYTHTITYMSLYIYIFVFNEIHFYLTNYPSTIIHILHIQI